MKKIFSVLLLLFSLSAFGQYKPVLTVAQDGSGDYSTIQEAVNSVRDLGQQQVTIRIRKGVYHEKLVIPSWKTHISLVGEDKQNTVITNNDYSGKANPGGRDQFGKEKFTTYTSYTVLVEGNDFTAENLTIENTAGRVGQAVALHVEADRCIVKNCNILGNQDTLYAAKEGSRQLYQDCFITGTTDFIFGEAIAVFQNCTIKNLTNSFVTAAATRQSQLYGFVLLNCRIVADTGVTKCFLGRPWRPYAKTVYINCFLDKHITPVGWNPWDGDAMFPNKDRTAYYAEYKSEGPGASTAQRQPWSKQLTTAEARKYTIGNILSGQDHWDAQVNHP
ncbi:pectinesterase family protein [Mucilaginibacter sp. RS28]|uniref:Pectinesterase n=1 Tax=Mucilaginibacter straminoryzae TaxID=2932774 RepID=A0A9X1X1Z5_9SPHI|nr:pectinesterase family protein [Mucilaginibacter straminoryzae]MCJ8208510.1 pectinesterase family protein [Mucilaginibacter straminoryzae]